MRNSLLISTYNWPQALRLVLKSVGQQTKRPDQILLADDGSDERTREVVAACQAEWGLEIEHIWQPDDGFRKAEILNKALARATGDYIVQVDGDCILHPQFIADHMACARQGRYLFGSRVNIQPHHLATLFADEDTLFRPWSAGIKNRGRAIWSPLLSMMYGANAQFSSKFRGCNCSYFLHDAVRVNGYNEAISGWGREDSEFAIRLHNAGLQGRRLRYRGIVFHVYHPERSRENLKANDGVEQRSIEQKLRTCEKGLNRHL